ncbi:uncharacterized protein [Ptychodera flava]|uniref:uncharacterized protein isoform X2 n=1 Tax=Ptychodera flava TaxID=63121 RepID=UPI00396A95CE
MDMPNNILSSLVQTRSVERVLAPIAAQVSQLIILNESSERNGESLPDLVPHAESVTKAVDELVEISQKLANESIDEELKKEIPLSCETVSLAGKDILLATQRLQVDSQSKEARNSLVKAARNVLEGTMKVLLVADNAEVRKIVKASHWLLDRLTLLQSVQTMKALVTCFKGFTEALLLLSNLTDKRQKELTNAKQRESVLSAMITLKKSAPMLSTAVQTYVKYPDSPQTKASKDYIVGQVISAVEDLIAAVKTTGGSQLEDIEEPGVFATRLRKVCSQLSQENRSKLNSEFDTMMESIVRHSMAVASVSREHIKNQVVDTCKEILKQGNELSNQAKLLAENRSFQQLKEDFNKSCDMLLSEFNALERHISQSLGYQVVDILLETTEPLDRLIKASVTPLKDKSVLREKVCVNMLEPFEEAFHNYSDRLIQLGGFLAASCADKARVRHLRSVINSLESLDPEIYPACIAARRDILDKGALEHVKLLRKEWHGEIATFLDIIDDMSDPLTFIDISETSMKSDIRECREAILISDSDLLAQAANRLLGRAKRVVQVASKVVDGHVDPIFRNGLQSFINQLQKAIPLVKNAAYETISLIHDARLHDKLQERCDVLMVCVARVKGGLDEKTHPAILSPLRKSIRSPRKPMAADYPEFHSPHHSLRSPDHNMYLSKPVPNIRVSSPVDSLYSVGTSPLTVTRSPRSSADAVVDVPPHFLNPIRDLLHAIEKRDRIQIEMLCGVLLTQTSKYKAMIEVMSKLSKDMAKVNILQSSLSELTAMLPELFDLARNTPPGDESGKAHLYVKGQEWAKVANQVTSTLEEVIGVWSMPAKLVTQCARNGDTEKLQAQIELLNKHIEQLHQLVAMANEVTITQSRVQSHRRSELMEHAQLMQSHANELSKLTQELNSAANHVVLNTVDKSKHTLLADKLQQWSVKAFELAHTLDEMTAGSQTNGKQLQPAMLRGEVDKVHDEIKKMVNHSEKMKDMTGKVIDGCLDQSTADSVSGICESLQQLTITLNSLVTSQSSGGESPATELETTLLIKQWALKVKLLESVIDELSNEMAIPIDRLAGAALAVNQAKGKSRDSLLEEYQNYTDELSSKISRARQDCNRAMRSVPASPPKYAVFSSVDTLCKLTPQIVAMARQIADDTTLSLEGFQDLKRQWACNAHQLIKLIQAVPNADQKAVTDVLTAFRMLRDTTPQDVTQALESALQSLGPTPAPSTMPTIRAQSPALSPVPMSYAHMQLSQPPPFTQPMRPTVSHTLSFKLPEEPMEVHHAPVHAAYHQPMRVTQPRGMPSPQPVRFAPEDRNKASSPLSRKSSPGTSTSVTGDSDSPQGASGTEFETPVRPLERQSPLHISGNESAMSPSRHLESAYKPSRSTPEITVTEAQKPETKPIASPHRTRPLTISTTSTPLSHHSAISTSTYYTTDTDLAGPTSSGGIDGTPTPPPKPEFSASFTSVAPPEGRKWETFLGSRHSKSLAAAALVLQQETDRWEDDNNAIVKVAKTMSAQMYDMADFTRGQGSLSCKEEVINTAKAIAANGLVIVKFARIIAKYCLDKRFSDELLHYANQIPSYGKQLSIIASVKAATPEDKSTDIVLVKNAENLMEAVMKTLKAAETASVKGLKQPSDEESGDETQATALAIQWKRKLDRHRKIEASYTETDDLGLRRINRNVSAPTLTEIFIQR